MMCSKARSSEREPGRVPAGFRSGLPFGFRSLSDTAPSLPALLDANAEVVPSAATSATRYERSERIGLALHIVTELEFVDVERQIGRADFMKVSDDAALNQRPETFDVLCVNCPDDIFFVRVPDDAVRILFTEAVIANPLVCDQQVHFVGNDL